MQGLLPAGVSGSTCGLEVEVEGEVDAMDYIAAGRSNVCKNGRNEVRLSGCGTFNLDDTCTLL